MSQCIEGVTSFWASVLSCSIFWRRVNDDISSFYMYTHVYAHLLHLCKAFKLKIAIIKTNTRNLTFFPSYIWSTKMQFLRIPCSNFHLIKTYLQVIGCPIENCSEYLEYNLNINHWQVLVCPENTSFEFMETISWTI